MKRKRKNIEEERQDGKSILSVSGKGENMWKQYRAEEKGKRHSEVYRLIASFIKVSNKNKPFKIKFSTP